jgi:hypothetical protein
MRCDERQAAMEPEPERRGWDRDFSQFAAGARPGKRGEE